jgi:hypothetical protein
MYRFEELTTDYGYPIESKIIHFLEFYNIPKENVVNIRIISNQRATIIFDSDNTLYDNFKAIERDWHEVEI